MPPATAASSDSAGDSAGVRYDVVASDLDGTLVRSDGSVSERTRTALARVVSAGAHVVLVTGRPVRWLTGIAEATGHQGQAICANGALVVDLCSGDVVSSRPFDSDNVRDVVDQLRSGIPGLTFAVERVGADFAHEPSYRPRWTGDSPVVADLEQLLAGQVVKLLARHDELGPDELLARARQLVGDEAATLTHSSVDGLLEISAAGVSKASALAGFCADLGVAADRVVAFGDMPNDLPMLTWAGRAVAVANAHPDVRAAADEITLSNDEDGVAVVLEDRYGG